jgi:hypothetical protein
MLIFPFPSVMTHSSTPRKRPTPKAGEAPKPAPTQEEIDEWLSPLNECIKEVKELVSQSRYAIKLRRYLLSWA